MRLTRLFGAALGTGFLFLALSSGANAWDGYRDRDHWRYDHERYHDHHDHWRRERPVVVHERPVVVRERPMVVERPVMMAPQPMYVQPMPYNQGPSGLNLNFNIPLGN
jgi:hypothetical protein